MILKLSIITETVSSPRTEPYIAEQEERRKLVSELRERIASDLGKKWVIRFGKVEAVGDFIQHNR